MLMYFPRSPKKQKRNDNFGKKQVKQNWQREVLWELFQDEEGPITPEIRENAIDKTGLEWRKIYKWIFDQGRRLKINRHLSKTLSNPGNPVELVFKIEKVRR